MAKGFITEFLVKVGSVGLSKTKKDVDQLATSTQKVGDAHAAAGKSAREHFNTQDKGIIGTANSTRSFSKLAQTMNGGGSSSVVGAYATLAANVFALTAAFNALRSAASMQQIEKGLEALGARTGQTLSITAKGMREVTGNAISMEQALRSTAQIVSAGFNDEQVMRLSKVANDASFALGRNMTDSMDRLTRGVIKLEPELLDELGIMTRLGEATKAYANELGKSEGALSTTERRQAFFNSVMAEGELKFGGLADAAGNTKGFDQLAASLSDVTKQTMNLINFAALPLAKLFSASPTALIGGALLFASTIKNQLLPGLTDLSKKSELAASSLTKQAKGQASVVASLQPANKTLQGLNEKIEDGTATLKHYQKGLDASGAALRKYTKELEQNYIVGDKSHKPLTDKQKSYRATEIDVLESYQSSLRNVVNAERQATAQSQASAAIELASDRKVLQAKDQLIAATKNYKNSLIASQKAQQTSATLMTNLRTAAFAGSVGVRALGAAFLNVLPIIGQIAFVVGLAIAAFKALESKESKALNSALKDLGTIVDGLSAKMTRLQEITKSQASASSKAVESLKLETNATIEFVNAIEKAIKAREASRKQEAKGSIKDVSGTNTSVYRALGMDWGVFNKLTADGKLAIETFEGFESLNPKGLEKLVKETKNWTKLKPYEQAKLMYEALKPLEERATKVSDALNQLVSTQKAAGDAVGAFSKSALATTSFDSAVSTMQAYGRAIEDTRALVKSGNPEFERFTAILADIPASIQSLMSVETSGLLNDLKTVTALQAKDNRNVFENNLLQTTKARIQASQDIVDLAIVEQGEITKRLEAAQRIVIVAKSENALASARLKASQANNALTSEGLRRQLEAENNIIKNNIIATRQEKLILESQLAQNDAKIKSIELERVKAEALRESSAIERKALIARAEANIREAEAIQDRSGLAIYTNYLIQSREELAKLREEAAADTDDAKAERERVSKQQTLALEQSSANLRNQILGVTNEIAALQTEINSAENINAKVKLRQFEIQQGIAKEYRGIRDVLRTVEQNETKLNILKEKGRVSLLEEANMSRAIVATNIEAIKTEAREERALNAEKLAQAKTEAGFNADTQKHFEQLDELSVVREQANIANLESAQRLEEVTKSIFDINKEGLEWQQNALKLVERQLTVQNELKNAVFSRAQAEDNLARKRAGYGERTAFGEQAEEIKAATKAYEIAKNEASVKKTLIDLEYALLEAQQVLLKEELAGRRELLSRNNGDGKFNENIAQIDRIVGTLNGINYKAMPEMAKRVIDESVKTAEANLEASATFSSGMINSAAKDYSDFRSARLDAARALSAPAAAAIAAPIIANAVEDAVTDPFVETGTALTTSISSLTSKVDELIRVMSPTQAREAATYTAREIAAAMGKYINASGQGMTAWQQPDIGNGRVGEHTEGSAHYSGRAIDVYSKPGNGEWNDPAERAKYKVLEDLIKSIGGATIFGGDHKDHLHAAFTDGSINMVKAIELLGDYLPKRVGAAIAEELPTVLEDVIVTASKGPIEVMDAPKSITLTDIPVANLPNIVPEWTIRVKEASEAMRVLNDQSTGLKSLFTELGPQGAAMNAAIEGMSAFGASLETAMNVFQKSGASTEEKIGAVATAAATALGGLRSTLSASADAKIEAIDREIAAEQKRDGKSAASVEKIAALERKKEAQAKKAFEVNKKLMMAQSIMSTAAAVAGQLGATPVGPWNIALAAAMGAMGAAQLAIIAGTSYQSTSAPAQQAAMPTTLSVGKRGDTVDLAKNNANAGGEIGYLRGARGQGRSAADYAVIGSAYGGSLPRGYGNTGYLVGEHGPEIIKPEVPVSVQPANDNQQGNPVNATFNIQALDASGVQDILHAQRGFIIGSLREAANANGETFMENVNTSVYTKPNVGRL